MTAAVSRAAARLDRPGLTPLVDELHHRFGTGEPPVRVRLPSITDEERRVLSDLLGSARMLRDPVRLDVRRLLALLGLASADELRAAVEQLRGPAGNRRTAREAQTLAHEELWSWLASEAARRPAVADRDGWLDLLRRRGVRGSPAEHRRWCADLLTVLDALPADGLTLAELAQDTLGDPHALDRGRSRAAAVLSAVGLRDPGPHDAEAVRGAWESVGVAPDALSSTVLTIGLRLGRDHPLGALATAPGEPPEPVVLTLSQLRRWPVPALPPTATAYVVENPSLLAAAARSDWDGPPLVCSSGRPTVAVLTLVRQLAAAGAQVRQHADLDPVGLAITSWLAERAGTIPWRMGAQDYLELVGDGHDEGSARSVTGTPWEPSLQRVMRERQVWAYEEQVRADLLSGMRAEQRIGEDPTA